MWFVPKHCNYRTVVFVSVAGHWHRGCSACAAFVAFVFMQCYGSHWGFHKRAHSSSSPVAMACREPLEPDRSLQGYILGNVKLCRFHIDQRCNRIGCKFAHSLADLVNPADIWGVNPATVKTDYPLPGRPLTDTFLAYVRKSERLNEVIPPWAREAVFVSGDGLPKGKGTLSEDFRPLPQLGTPPRKGSDDAGQRNPGHSFYAPMPPSSSNTRNPWVNYEPRPGRVRVVFDGPNDKVGRVVSQSPPPPPRSPPPPPSPALPDVVSDSAPPLPPPPQPVIQTQGDSYEEVTATPVARPPLASEAPAGLDLPPVHVDFGAVSQPTATRRSTSKSNKIGPLTWV